VYPYLQEVLFLILVDAYENSYTYLPLGLGGGAVHVYELSKELLKRGHDVTIIHRPGATKIKIEPFYTLSLPLIFVFLT